MQQVARRAGVSAMTVSRVLHNSPRVLPATQAKVRKVLDALGYEPDPQLSRLMALVRSRKPRQIRATIAVIRGDASPDIRRDPAHQYVSIEDIRRRGMLHGYAVEEFKLGVGGMTRRRLESILRARSIEGIIVSPHASADCRIQLDYGSFAAATFGYGLRVPDLHRASTNMMQGILMATAKLAARGYQRIGLAITQWIDERADHAYSGAMLHYQQTVPRKHRIPLLLLKDNNIERGGDFFCRWARAHRPDAIISFDTHVPQWLSTRLKLKIPRDIALVVHDWTESMSGLAGIHHQRTEVAAAAVDLVAHQLLQNERGIPRVPRQILIPAAWVDGGSI